MGKIRKAAQLLLHPTAWSAFVRTRTVAAFEHRAALSFVKPDLLLDVGANKGQFSLITRDVCPAASIIAFEPLPHESVIFRRNLAGHEGVTLIERALSDFEGQTTFYVTNRADSSSLLPVSEKADTAFNVVASDSIAVRVSRLDEVLTPSSLHGTALLKLDVQGAELDVLRGATEILDKVRFIYAEVSFVELYVGQPLADEFISAVGALGFRLRGVYNPSSTAAFGPTQADLLFERR